MMRHFQVVFLSERRGRYNGKAAETELKPLQQASESGHLFQEHDLLRHNLVVFRNGENALQVPGEDRWASRGLRDRVGHSCPQRRPASVLDLDLDNTYRGAFQLKL